MARTRRRKTWIAAVAVLIALWLWLAGPARIDPNADGALPAPPRADPESAPSPVVDPAPKARSDESITAPTPAPSAAAADRFGVARFGVDDAIRTGRVALAWRLVDELAAGTSEPPLKAAVAKRVAELDAETDAWFTELRREIAAGEVLAAEARVRRADSGGRDGPFADRFAAACTARGWPRLHDAAVAGAPPSPPSPAALTNGRAVRVVFGERVRDGRLQSVRAHEATVRLADDGGVTFPTVPLSEVDPVDPSVDEALVAAATTRPLRARLWVAHLVERGQRDDQRVAAWLAHFGG